MDINIKAFEITAQAAKDFLQKVVTPPLEEIGGLLADQIKIFRLKNQVQILKKAEDYMNQNGLKTRKVNLKVLVPMLENSSLEEDESLQDKWASLFVNTVRDDSHINTTLFSHILSQMTRNDANLFNEIFEYCTQTTVNGNKRITIKFADTAYFMKSKDSAFIIDNLLRLRLIKEKPMVGRLPERYYVTELGLSFMMAIMK